MLIQVLQYFSSAGRFEFPSNFFRMSSCNLFQYKAAIYTILLIFQQEMSQKYLTIWISISNKAEGSVKMKRLRYLVVVVLLVALVTLTGCLPAASKLRGTWQSTEPIGGHTLEVTFGQDVGGKFLVAFAYSYKTTIKWGSKQWTIDSNADASESDYEYCLWVGTNNDNVLGVWKWEDIDDLLYIDFEMTAKLDGNKLYIDYLAIDNYEYFNNGDFGPEYLVKK
jgi:hypothetical protein